jgi:hypothetical protein
VSSPAPTGAPATVTQTLGLDPGEPGARWWTYRRPPLVVATLLPAPPPVGTEASGSGANGDRDGDRARRPAGLRSSGLALGMLAAGLLGVVVLATRVFDQQSVGAWLIPIAGIIGAVAFGRRARRLHPDEPWIPQLLLVGTLVKLAASYLRYLTLTKGYGGIGDATVYDRVGRQFVAAWTGLGEEPVLSNLRQSNFMRWFTGVLYFLFGQSLFGAFLLLSLVAVVGSYFWYRALVDSTPSVNKQLYLIFLLFAPSIVFWPSSLGKEALMQLAVGAAAWATALALTGRFIRAVPLIIGGGWLLWLIRPHLLALVTVAATIPYLFGRVHKRRGALDSFLTRPIGVAVMCLLVVFTVTSGAKYLGIEKLSFDAVQEQLDEETERTSTGGSAYAHHGNSLSPLALPNGLVTVLIRPFPWETDTGFQLLAALESTVVLGLIAFRFRSVVSAVRRWRVEPFLLYCIVLLVFYAMTFSSIANFGLLNRQRSLVLPALYALIAVEPALARKVRNGNGHQPAGAAR